MDLRECRVVAFAAVAVLAVSAQAQTTWYVDAAGVPPGTGTQGNPYTSLQYGITRTTTVSGDTLLVAPGTYVENVNYSGKRLIVRSTGGPLVTTLRSAGAPQVVSMSQLASGYSELEGFTVTGYEGAGPTTIGVKSFSGVIRRCILHGEDGTGTAIYASFEAFVERSTIVGNMNGISGQEDASAWIEESILWANSYPLKLTGHGSGPIYEARYCAGGPFQEALVSFANLEVDPGLWYLPARDVHLRPGSVCIDAGACPRSARPASRA
jgi:hypothetical protein